MSSDYLDDVECNGSVVLLTMRASGFAELVVMEENKEGAVGHFPLIPNRTGLENAEKIASALRAWSEHIQQGLVQGEDVPNEV